MSVVFRGRAVVPGDGAGEALVSRSPFNVLASFKTSLFLKSRRAACSDSNNKDLYHKLITGKILCLSRATGSTSAGMLLQTVAQRGIAPKALLFPGRLDTLTASGVILANIWCNNSIITIDQLGDAFLAQVTSGQWIKVSADGTVIVEPEAP